ncbi:MAG TPA: endolytic transglycosylase MltG, partial [Nevskiaceae bacterium]|nr:endolytic transglycosylase MltG [Nevskiaceae bacterium]
MKALRTLILLLIVAFVGVFAIVRDMQSQLHAQLRLTSPSVFEVIKGQSLDTVMAELAAHQWLPSARTKQYLKLYLRLKPELAAVKAGEYELMPAMTPLDVLGLFASGHVILHELTIPEGWRFSQALQAVQQNDALQHTLPATASAADVMAAV